MNQYQLPYQNYGAPSGQSNFGGSNGVKSGTNIFGGVNDQSNPFGANAATAQGTNPVAAAVGNATAALTGTGGSGGSATDTTGGASNTTHSVDNSSNRAADQALVDAGTTDYYGWQISHMPTDAQSQWQTYQSANPLNANDPNAVRDQATGFINSYQSGELNAMTPAQVASETSIPHDSPAFSQYWMNKISPGYNYNNPQSWGSALSGMPLAMDFATEIPMMNSDQLLAYAGLPSGISLGTAQSQVISPYYSSTSFLNKQNPAPTGGSIASP